MILFIDIGNTNVVCALWDGQIYLHSRRIESISGRNEKFSGIKSSEVESIIISSVVPLLTDEYISDVKEKFNLDPFIVTHENCGIQLLVDQPNEVGADRICNVAAASTLFDCPIIVVDFGSATTYDVINEDSAFIGGAIAPGIDVSAHHLIEKTALLRSAAFQFPKTVVGKNTESNLQSGIMFGGVDAVTGMLSRIQTEMNWDNCTVILTGGFSSLISPKLDIPHTLSPDLTLDGMRIVAGKNKPI